MGLGEGVGVRNSLGLGGVNGLQWEECPGSKVRLVSQSSHSIFDHSETSSHLPLPSRRAGEMWGGGNGCH